MDVNYKLSEDRKIVNTMESLKSKVNSKGQIVIPKQIRIKYGIKASTTIRWVQREDGLLMVPESGDPIFKARGMFKKSGMLKKLMAEKKLDKKKENSNLRKILESSAKDFKEGRVYSDEEVWGE